MDMLIVSGIFGFGLVFGSFVNAWVWRLSKQLDKNGEPKNLSKAQKHQYSILTGRSMCPNCKHILASKDLVPVFSWLALKGKCRYCKAKISWQYPLVELALALTFVFVYIFWPLSQQGSGTILLVGFLATLVPLFTLAIYDIKYLILPDKVLFPTVLFYLLLLLVYSAFSKQLDTIGMAFLSGLIYFAIFVAIYALSAYALKKGYSKQRWLGFGDVKMVFLLGLLVGQPILIFVSLFVASILGLLVALPGVLSNQIGLKSYIPFGPFLIAGAILTALFGQAVLDWYATSVLGIM